MNIRDLHAIFLEYPNICTDSRHIIPDAIFFALKGANFDGNQYVEKALLEGCVYAVTDSPLHTGKQGCIVVDDVLTTLQKLAAYHRSYLDLPILGITGTNGKTTTKELIHAVVSTKYTTVATKGNLNNHIGVPLTLLAMDNTTQFGIVEMGANHPDEITDLCQIAKPNYGLITNIGKAHLDGFGSPAGVRKAKGELYDYLQQSQGLAFYNSDDAVLCEMVGERHDWRHMPYGTTLYEVSMEPRETPYLRFRLRGELIETALVGDYNLNNVLAAVAIGQYLEIQTTQIAAAIRAYQPQNNRSQLVTTAHNTLIMDAYNANPSSMKAAIENFAALEAANKLLILGDMLELGKESETEHRKIIELLGEKGLKRVLLVGAHFTQAAGQSSQLTTFPDKTALTDYLKQHVVKDHTILIKGSRGIGLEVVQELL